MDQLVAPAVNAVAPYDRWGITLYPQENLIPGKTGTYDDAVMLDTDPWMTPFLELLKANRPPDARLWTISGARVIQLFLQAVAVLGMSLLAPVRYSLRHGGASDDILTKRRSLLEVKRRGQWRTDQSLRRYGKETKAIAEVNKIPPNVLEYGQQVSLNLEAVFHQVIILEPPIVHLPKRQRSNK